MSRRSRGLTSAESSTCRSSSVGSEENSPKVSCRPNSVILFCTSRTFSSLNRALAVKRSRSSPDHLPAPHAGTGDSHPPMPSSAAPEYRRRVACRVPRRQTLSSGDSKPPTGLSRNRSTVSRLGWPLLLAACSRDRHHPDLMSRSLRRTTPQPSTDARLPTFQAPPLSPSREKRIQTSGSVSKSAAKRSKSG